MKSFRLLWALSGSGRTLEESRGKKDDATLDDVLTCLDEILGDAGLVELVAVDPPEVGPRGMQLRTEGGLSILTLAEVNANHEKSIRLYRSGGEGEEVEILGTLWKSRFVCRDEALVREGFAELFSTGDVSRELLS